MVSRFIKEAWNAYKKNAGLIMSAQIAYFLVIFAILLISFMPLLAVGAKTLLTKNAAYAPDALTRLSGPFAVFFVGIVLAAVAAVVLDTGRIGIYADILKKKETRVQAMFYVAMKKFWTSVGSAILSVGIISVVAFAVIFLATVLAATSVILAPLIASVAILSVVLFALLFTLTRQSIVVGNHAAVGSVEDSYSMAKRNYSGLFAIAVVITAIGILLTFAGALGTIVIFIVLKPVADIAYTLFYMEKAGKGKEIEKEVSKETKIIAPPSRKERTKKRPAVKRKQKKKAAKSAGIPGKAMRRRTQLINP